MIAAQRLALCPIGVLVGGIGHHPGALPGRDNAILPESTSSHVNCRKTRTAKRLNTIAPVLVRDAVLAPYYRLQVQRQLNRLLHRHGLALCPKHIELRFSQHGAEPTHELRFLCFFFVRSFMTCHFTNCLCRAE